MSEHRAFVEGFALAHDLTAEWEGEIGFGRECVGLLDEERHSYVAYSYEGGCGPVDAPDAYHKDNYIAVLGRGENAEEQLANWVRHLAESGVRFERRPKDVQDLGWFAFGHTDEMTAFLPEEAKV